MKMSILLFAFYFFILNVLPCVKPLEFCQESSCCSKSCDQSEKNTPEQPEEDCIACNPLSSCDCCTLVLFSAFSFNFLTASTHFINKVRYCEFIPSTIISSV